MSRAFRPEPKDEPLNAIIRTENHEQNLIAYHRTESLEDGRFIGQVELMSSLHPRPAEKETRPGWYVIDRDLKYDAMPLSSLLMVALGIVLSLDPVAAKLGPRVQLRLALAIGFGYWLALGLTSSLGRSAIIPAWVAAWPPNFAFATIALSIFLFGEEG